MLTLLFVVDKVIICKIEYNLQKSAYKLNEKGHSVTVSAKKTKLCNKLVIWFTFVNRQTRVCNSVDSQMCVLVSHLYWEWKM